MLNQLKEISLFLKSMDNGADAALIQQGYMQDVTLARGNQVDSLKRQGVVGTL